MQDGSFLPKDRLHKTSYTLDDGAPLFDGVCYPSRNNFPAKCVALFDRAQTKITVVDDIELHDHADWPQFVKSYRIGIEPIYVQSKITKASFLVRNYIPKP